MPNYLFIKMNANVELIKKFYKLFALPDKQAYLELCHDNVEWHVLDGMPNGGKYMGKKQVFDEYFPKLFANFIEFHAVAEEFLAAKNQVIVFGRYIGVGKKTKKKFESPFAHIYTLKNGQIIKYQQYTDTAKIQDVLNTSK